MKMTEKKTKITVDDLYDHIVKYLTPEEALKKLLVGSILNYEKLKFDGKENSVHPEIIIVMAAADLGWQMAIEKDAEVVRGMCVGTEDYMTKIFGK